MKPGDTKRWTLVAVAGLALAGAGDWIAAYAQDRAEPQAANKSRCLTSPVERSRIIDDSTVAIQDIHGTTAILTLSGPCLKQRNEMMSISFLGGGSQLCHKNDVTITGSAYTTIPLTCTVKSVQFVARDSVDMNRGR